MICRIDMYKISTHNVTQKSHHEQDVASCIYAFLGATNDYQESIKF